MKVLVSRLWIFVILSSFFLSATNCFSQEIRRVEVVRKLDSTEVAKTGGSFKTEKEIRKNWSKLRKGMKSDKVIKLLGNPDSESITNDGSLCFWKYKRGELVFNGVTNTLSKWDK